MRAPSEHRRADAFAAAILDVVADRRDQGNLRLHVPGELAFDLTQIVANRPEHLRERETAEGFCAVGFKLVY
jgi:hypothetical protein